MSSDSDRPFAVLVVRAWREGHAAELLRFDLLEAVDEEPLNPLEGGTGVDALVTGVRKWAERR